MRHQRLRKVPAKMLLGQTKHLEVFISKLVVKTPQARLYTSHLGTTVFSEVRSMVDFKGKANIARQGRYARAL